MNPVLKKFIEIKNAYVNEIGNVSYKYTDGYTDESQTCLERWIEELNKLYPCGKYNEYVKIASYLQFNQHNDFLLIRYARYSNVFDGETEATSEDFWDLYDGLFRECRSVVIDVKNDCIVLCPFAKFFNIDELEETNINVIKERINKAHTIEFSDKLDGSMQAARYYNGEVVMSGSQAINPEKSWRLEDGLRMLKSNPCYVKMLKDFPHYTFIFEYISLKDAHVVKYTKEQEGLYLIGIRNVQTGVELDYKAVLKIARDYNILSTELFDKTLDQVMSELDDKSSDEAEGFVINIDGYKVKLKYNDYVHIHKALSKLSSINLIIRSIADDNFDDLISKLPVAYHDNVNKVAKYVINYVKETEKEIYKYYNEAPKENKKDFMIYADKHIPKKYRGYCHSLFLGKEFNVLKGGNDKQPCYKKLKDMGVTDYSKLFEEE